MATITEKIITDHKSEFSISNGYVEGKQKRHKKTCNCPPNLTKTQAKKFKADLEKKYSDGCDPIRIKTADFINQYMEEYANSTLKR